MAVIFEKLERMRADIQKDKEKVTELLERIKVKEAKLKEAEANLGIWKNRVDALNEQIAALDV